MAAEHGQEDRTRGSVEGRLRAAVADALFKKWTDDVIGSPDLENDWLKMADAAIEVVVDQAAEQIKALPLNGILGGVRWRDDVLAVLNEMRGEHTQPSAALHADDPVGWGE